MTDIVLQPASSEYELSKVNTNFTRIEDKINNEILHLIGGNNTMYQQLDMNSNRIINLVKPLYYHEPVIYGQLLELSINEVNNATNIFYEDPEGQTYQLDDFLDLLEDRVTDVEEAVEAQNETYVININSVYDLNSIDTSTLNINMQFKLKSWHPGNPDGGMFLQWDPTLPRSTHNGGTIFSPTVPSPQLQTGSNLGERTSNYLDGVGETASPFASGCFVLVSGGPVSLASFGAVKSTVSSFDSSPCLQKAVDELEDWEPLYIPEGVYDFFSAVWFGSKSTKVTGAGANRTFLNYRSTQNSHFLNYRNTGGLGEIVTLQDLTLTTPISGAHGGVYVTSAATGADPQVVGERDCLIMTNIYMEQSGSGYWENFLMVENQGGVKLSNCHFDNHDNYVQDIPEVKGVVLKCSSSAIRMIRTLTWDGVYILRTYDAIVVDTPFSSIESMYLSNGEIVGCGHAALNILDSHASAIGWENIHVDTTGTAIDAFNGDLTLSTFNGCDFRQGSNGGAFQPQPTVGLNNGEMILFSGCIFSGGNSTSPSALNQAFGFNSTLSPGIRRMSVTGNAFRDYYNAFGPSYAHDIVCSGNTYNTIENAVFIDNSLDGGIVKYDSLNSKSFTVQLDASGDQYIDVPVAKMFNERYPVAILQAASANTTEEVNIIYDFENSSPTNCRFRVQGNTVVRNCRFSLIACGIMDISQQ